MDSSAPSDSLNGLKFGQKIYFEDVGVSSGSVGNNPNKSGGSGSCSSAGDVTPASPAKKGRFGGGGGQGGQQPPRCQVEGCKVDLSDAKGYYARHKVCVMHSKSSMVVVSGNEQRFCQQCSRFHHLPEFDQGKRSCRRRLAGHNERRRKPPPGSLLSTCYGGLSSTLYENSSGTGSFVDFTTYPRAAWRDQSTPTRAFEQVAGNQHHVFRRLLPWQSNSESPQPEIQGSINNPSHSTDVSSGGFFTGAADSGRALSLLSSQPCNLKGQYSNLGSNYELDPDTVHMVQPTAVHGANISHFPRRSWDYKGNETGTSSLNMHSDSTLGQITQPGNRVYTGDLQVNQQRGRTSTSLEQPRAYYSSAHNTHWSI